MPIHHMVLLKFKPSISEDKIDVLFSQIAELKNLIPGIEYYADGPYSSPEGMNEGYTHGFLMTFENVKTRDEYLPHPEHERVKSAILPCVDGACGFDFETDVPFPG